MAHGPPTKKGRLRIVLRQLSKREFKLTEIYALCLNEFVMREPHIKNMKATIRSILQKLRDENFITFVDYKGVYAMK